MKITNFTILFFITIFLGTALSCSNRQNSSNSVKQKMASAPAESFEKISLNEIEEKTREASVKIHTPSGGHGTGTYFLYEGYHVVFTAAHVVDESGNYLVVDKYGNKRIGMIVYKDVNIDFAILLIPSFEKVKPLRFSLPSYDPAKEIGKKIIFSGYPARQSLRTTRGAISGVEGRHVVVHSTAWPGSSGSSVFDKDGKFVGILFAITVGRFSGEPVLLESMIWVEPYTAINWNNISKVIRSLN